MSTQHHPMVVAAARELSRQNAEACGNDVEHEWWHFCGLYLADAQVVLDACGATDLLEALEGMLLASELYPESTTNAVARSRAKAAIAKAKGEA